MENDPTQVGWFQVRPERSLKMIEASSASKTFQLIDVGGGASTLVDHLVAQGYENLTVLDISSAALEKAKARLGEPAQKVNWIVGDITEVTLSGTYDLWHDRAVFHFLTEQFDKDRYLANLKAALKPGGHLVIASFCLEGPQKCSGLPVCRYSSESLQQELGEDFELIQVENETHVTPFNVHQEYVFCRFLRK